MKTISILIISLFFVAKANGQCYPDRHNTNWYDGWMSCNTATNPNNLRPDSHWIKYDLGSPYFLSTLHYWNNNDPENLDRGLQEVVIDYSMDGFTWTELGAYTFAQGSGRSVYEGEIGPDFGGIEAQYVLITALSNYGASCYGLSEIRIDVIEGPPDPGEDCLTVNITPNPFRSTFEVTIDSDCDGPVYYTLSNQIGLPISRKTINDGAGLHQVGFEGTRNLGVGVYYLEVTQNGVTRRFPIVKMSSR